LKKKVLPGQIEKIDKMREVAKFLNSDLDTMYIFQNRYWKRGKNGNKSKLLLYRLLMHLDLNEVRIFLDDNQFQKSLFLMDNQDILMGNSLSFDRREIV
jgi:hypothetical protein